MSIQFGHGRSASGTRARILSVGYGLLYKEGFSRVSMDAVAAAAGVTKRTLYLHFESKDAMVAEMLAEHHNHAMQKIRSWASDRHESPTDLISCIFDGLYAWASDSRWLGSGFTRLTMELANLPGHPARNVAHRHKKHVESWLSEEFERLGVQDSDGSARVVTLLIEGCMSLVLIHGDPSYILAAKYAANHLVFSSSADE